jgi:uncharacterized damage-inducible protein DinB
MSDFPALDITPYWRAANDNLIQIVDAIPDDKLNWSPKPELWNFRGILLHIAGVRDGWLGTDVKDGLDVPSVYTTVRSKSEIQQAYRRTWDRLAAFLGDERKLAVTYTDEHYRTATGHWIAFHLLEHDIHHRADLLHYLALLDVDTSPLSPP